ncbi:MAG: c-type cytochrome [Methylophilaceae bacterium]
MFRIILFSVFVTFIFSSCSDQNKELSSNKVISIKFTKTTDGTEFKVSGKQLEGTPAEAEFFKTGKNIYVGDAKAEKRGKKRFGYWSCTQCHGPTAKGQVGPGLVGPTFKYPKNATNKGMFETAWFGTNGGMGGKGYGIMAPEDGLTVDELLKIIAWVRTNGKGITGNEDLNEQ